MEKGKYYAAKIFNAYYFIKYKSFNKPFVIGEIYIIHNRGIELSYGFSAEPDEFVPIDEKTFYKIKTIYETNMPILLNLCKAYER